MAMGRHDQHDRGSYRLRFFYPDDPLWRVVGRMAFPVYAYLLVQGYLHTRSVWRYLLRLLFIFAVAQIPYMALLKTLEMNVVGTLLISLTVLWAIDKLSWGLKTAVIAAAAGLLLWIPFDYGVYGLILVLVYRYVRTYWAVAAHAVLTLILYAGVPIQMFSVLATLLLYAGALPISRQVPAWLWRSFYPLHLGILFIWFTLQIN